VTISTRTTDRSYFLIFTNTYEAALYMSAKHRVAWSTEFVKFNSMFSWLCQFFHYHKI